MKQIKDYDSTEGLERNSLLQIAYTVQASEAAEVACAVEALTCMWKMPTNVSPTRHCNSDCSMKEDPTRPYGAKRPSTQVSTMSLKRKRKVQTQPKEQLVDDRAAESCILCPVCSLKLKFLPLDTDFMEPVRSPSLSKSMKDHSDMWLKEKLQ